MSQTKQNRREFLKTGAAGLASIPKIDLIMEAGVPNVSDEEFQEIAKTANEKCPVSRVLAGAEISHEATLRS